MTGAERFRPYAFLCALVVVLCALIAYPVANVGVSDDWSYIYSARMMAQTGRFVYVGWASAMLGWMIPLGAAFIKLFGFSFTAVRASVVLIAAVNAYLLACVFFRCGLNRWNAVVATLTLILCPIYLPLATSFMTDVPGMLVATFGFYCCLRALEASSSRAISAWIAAACISSAIGGTARQTAWLVVMVMVPCACWLLRRRRLPWIAVAAVWIASLSFIVASLHWFHRQPYSLGEALEAAPPSMELIRALGEHVTRAALTSLLFLLPLTLAFLPHMRLRSRRVQLCVGLVAALTLVFAIRSHHKHDLLAWLAPFAGDNVGNYLTEKGLAPIADIGARGAVLAPWIRLVVTLAVWAGAVAVLAYFIAPRDSIHRTSPAHTGSNHGKPGYHELLVLLVPYAAVYTLLLLHRAMFSIIFDRYLPALLFIPVLFLALTYQDRIAPRLPAICLAVAVIFGAFATAADHDLFAMKRARLRAVTELESAGVSPSQFYGGWEFDAWTQVSRYGFVNARAMNTPAGFSAAPPIYLRMKTKPCDYAGARLFPAIQPEFALSFDPVSCAGPSPFQPVGYSSWLPPYGSKIYIQKVTGRVY